MHIPYTVDHQIHSSDIGISSTYSIQRLGRSQGAFEGFIFPICSIFNGELRSYLEFPNHVVHMKIQGDKKGLAGF